VRRLLPRRKAPLGLAGFLAIPLVFSSLMAVSLAIDKPHRYEWTRGGKLVHIDHPTESSLETRIWLLSLVPSLVLVAIGFGAAHWRRGLYVVALAGVLIPLATTHRLDRWERHHTARYPVGADLISPSSTSDTLLQGQWEATAKETALQLAYTTLALSLAAAALAAGLEVRRRRRPASFAVAPPTDAERAAQELASH
jgi:hypothetical protein